MKKIIILSVIAAVFLIGAVVYSDMANKQAAEGNPFGKTNLNPATIAQLDDPNYGNQILPDELKAKLEGKEELFIYYYSPTCEHCQRTTPVLVPVADELKVDVKKHTCSNLHPAGMRLPLSTPLLSSTTKMEKKYLVWSANRQPMN